MVFVCIKEYNQCVESARSGEQEVEELKQALSDARVQCKALELKNTDLLRAHSQLAQQLRKQVYIPDITLTQTFQGSRNIYDICVLYTTLGTIKQSRECVV